MPIILPIVDGGGLSLLILREYVRDELGADLGAVDFISNDDLDRYLNDGMQRLGYYRERVAPLTWSTDDVTIPLPEDFVSEDRLILDTGITIPPRSIWGGQYNFGPSIGASSDGTARLFYYARWPTLTDDQGSLLPDPGNVAIVAFATYRCYKRIASSRAEYKRYSTITQTNGVTMDDLQSMADQYYTEFLEARDSLPPRSAQLYYSD